MAANQSYLHEKLIAECNEILSDELKSVPQVILLDLGAELASYDGSSFDPRLEFVGNFLLVMASHPIWHIGGLHMLSRCWVRMYD